MNNENKIWYKNGSDFFDQIFFSIDQILWSDDTKMSNIRTLILCLAIMIPFLDGTIQLMNKNRLVQDCNSTPSLENGKFECGWKCFWNGYGMLWNFFVNFN